MGRCHSRPARDVKFLHFCQSVSLSILVHISKVNRVLFQVVCYDGAYIICCVGINHGLIAKTVSMLFHGFLGIYSW